MLFSSIEAPYQYKKVGLIKNRDQGTHPKLVVETDDVALLNHRFDTINLTAPNSTTVDACEPSYDTGDPEDARRQQRTLLAAATLCGSTAAAAEATGKGTVLL